MVLERGKMNDLISRQAAIDALNSLQKFSLMDSNEYLHGVGVRLKFAVQKLEQLPSAQQEIIRCKDCKYNDFEEQNSTTKWLPCIDAAWYDNWFCGCAERRNNG